MEFAFENAKTGVNASSKDACVHMWVYMCLCVCVHVHVHMRMCLRKQ